MKDKELERAGWWPTKDEGIYLEETLTVGQIEAVNDLIAQERRKAKIEVLEKPILLELHIKQSQDYKQGFRDAVEQVESYRKDKLAELKEDKE